MLYVGSRMSFAVSSNLFSFQPVGLLSGFFDPPSQLGRSHQAIEQLLQFSPGHGLNIGGSLAKTLK